MSQDAISSNAGGRIRLSDDDRELRVLTIRLPGALHRQFCDAAWRHRKSANQLAVTALLDFLARDELGEGA